MCIYKSAPLILAFVGSIFSFESEAKWEDDYEVSPGFRVEIDAQGLLFPTALAFVQEPDSKPESPLYFVTEIRGRVRVVTNDRSVHTFAENFYALEPDEELPAQSGEVGMAGLCLDAESGAVFVSYVYQDSEGLYRNGLSRFESEPRTFGLSAKSHERIAPFLGEYLSAVSHQIGPLAISDGYLYVCIGDGEVARDSRNIDSPNGKILRMTLDGRPAPGNPHAVDADPNRVANYIWASGLRNPFSLKIVEGRVFVADNGPQVDRFVEVRAGDDLLYDGTNESIATNALFVWRRSVSPVQMEFNPAKAKEAGFPEFWQNAFLFPLSGSPIDPPGPSQHGSKSVVGMGFDFESGRVSQIPAPLLNYKASGVQLPVAVAFGPGGLYLAPLFPDSEGNESILKISYDPENQHPNVFETLPPAEKLLQQHACYACHIIDGKGVGYVGPMIDRPSLAKKLLSRLESKAYRDQVREVDQLDTAPFSNYRDVRQGVLDANGRVKARVWLKNRLLEPRFDQQVIAMPNLGLTEEEAEALTDWLLLEDSSVILERGKAIIKSIVPKPNHTSIVITFSIGVIVGLIFFGAMVFVIGKYRGSHRK